MHCLFYSLSVLFLWHEVPHSFSCCWLVACNFAQWLTVRSNWKRLLYYIIHIQSSLTWLLDGIGVVVSLQRMMSSVVLCWNLIDLWVSYTCIALLLYAVSYFLVNGNNEASISILFKGLYIRLNFVATIFRDSQASLTCLWLM